MAFPFVASRWVWSSELPSSSSLLLIFFAGWSGQWRRVILSLRLRIEPTVGIVSETETIFTAALSGLPGNKAGIDPPNEPTQQSLLLDLYLLKSGEEKSSSFSTFHCFLSAYWLFCQSRAHLLECLGLENIRKWIIFVCSDNKRTETFPRGRRVKQQSSS